MIGGERRRVEEGDRGHKRYTMASMLRRKNDPPPDYSDIGDQFSVEVHHGDFFWDLGR